MDIQATKVYNLPQNLIAFSIIGLPNGKRGRTENPFQSNHLNCDYLKTGK